MAVFRADQPGSHCRTSVSRGPLLGIVLVPEIVFSGLEGLQGHGQIAVVVVADRIKIISSLVHGQITAPVAGIAFQGHLLAGSEVFDPVWPAAHRHIQGRGRQVTTLPVFFRKILRGF